jgi:hypothetical protein
LNVSDDVPNYYESKESRLTYLKLFVQDFGQDSGISRVFTKAFEYVSPLIFQKDIAISSSFRLVDRFCSIILLLVSVDFHFSLLLFSSFPDVSFSRFINAAKNCCGKILVHCMQGQNRSVSVVLAYLMTCENMSLKEAICHIRSAGRSCCPFRDNIEELIRYETSLFGVASMTVDDFLINNLHRSHSDGTMTSVK